MARALFANLIAVAVISAFIYLNQRMALVPSLDILSDIARFNVRIGLPSTSQAAWVTHALLGIVGFGVIFAIIQPILPGRNVMRGVWFGFLVWLTMMAAFLPLAQHEVFAFNLGPEFAVLTLALHLVYGLVLGLTYAALGDESE